MLSNFTLRRATTFSAVLTFLACSDANAPQSISKEQVSGTYVTDIPTTGTAFGSLTFSTTENGVVVDQVARGAKIELVLASDGTTRGSILVPDVETDEDTREPFIADLAGSWRLEDNVVTLTHGADTFLRDMPLTVKGDRLEGDRTFGDVRVRVALVRR
jgi:hypothetical protein